MGVNGIYGLSGSGLDIESLVKMGMSNQNKQYDKMEQKEIANTWLKEAYNDVYNDLTTYKYGTLSTYKMQSNLNAMQASSSNTGVVTATANGAAAAMNHTVTVDSVASNAYLLTSQREDGTNYGITRANGDAQTSNKLADVIFGSYSVASYTQEGNNFNFTYRVNGQEVNGSDVAISLRLKDTAGSDTEYTLTYTYDELFTGVKSGEYTGYTGDQSSLFSGGKSLNDFASAIAKTGANIQGGFDTSNDSFSLYNKTSGKENIIGITADNGNTATLLNNLNLGSYDVSTNKLGDRIDFTADNVMKTVMESNGIANVGKSVSMKDVLGLSAKSVSNGDGSYNITVSDKDGNSLGTFTKNADGSFTGADEQAFAINISNGTDNATVSFTLGELFKLDDIGQRTNLRAGAGLDEFAAKINAAGLGITADYDSAKDSFSVNNPTGQANLTAVAGNGEAVANQLISSLNLATSTNLHAIGTDNANNLADVFGLSMTVKKANGDNYTVQVKDGSTVIGTQKGGRAYFTAGTGAEQNLFSFEIGDGTNSSTVDVSFGDIIDYTAFRDNGYILMVNGTKIESSGTPQKNPNNLSVLADKINEAAGGAGLNIIASYGDGKFTIANPEGNVTINNVTGSPLNVVGKLGLGEIADPSNMTFKTSSSITRVNEHSTEDSLADGLGLTAVKNNDGSLTVTRSDGSSSTVNADDVAFTLKVGDSNKQTEAAFTYADLFDTNGSGNLRNKGDFSTLVSKLNEAAESGGVTVAAAYDGETGKFSLTNNGGYATLSGVDSLGKELVKGLGLTESEETSSARDHSWAGTNATVTIDGKSYENATNKLTVAGVTYTFLDQTQAGQKATISVSQDTDKIVDYMKSFVDDYNKLLDSLNEKLAEKKYSDYKPLSKRQEEEMTEKQIEKWNEKAKSGLLYHNSEIQDLVSAMREAIYSKVDAVDSKYNTLASIGITSTNTKGHLTLDTDKLKKALAEDPDCVYQLFASDQDSTYIAGSTNKNKITSAQQRQDYANTGVANRLYNVMTNHMSKISDIAGTSKDANDQSYLGKLITDMQTKMKSFKTQMSAYESKLFKRYDAMEVALSRLNMQLGYIAGSFS